MANLLLLLSYFSSIPIAQTYLKYGVALPVRYERLRTGRSASRGKEGGTSGCGVVSILGRLSGSHVSL